jgi:hypothetical protein
MRNIEINEFGNLIVRNKKETKFNFMNELDKKFQGLGWRDTTEAYYGLDYTPFMCVIEELIENKIK